MTTESVHGRAGDDDPRVAGLVPDRRVPQKGQKQGHQNLVANAVGSENPFYILRRKLVLGRYTETYSIKDNKQLSMMIILYLSFQETKTYRKKEQTIPALHMTISSLFVSLLIWSAASLTSRISCRSHVTNAILSSSSPRYISLRARHSSSAALYLSLLRARTKTFRTPCRRSWVVISVIFECIRLENQKSVLRMYRYEKT